MSVNKNILQNGIASALQKLIRVAQQLVLIPFFISNWGAAYYGEWLTLTIIPTMLAFSDLGFGSAVANSFVLKYASNDKQGAANIAKTGFRVITATIFLAMVLGCITIIIGNYYNLFQNSLIPKHDAIWAVSILMLARLSGFYNQMYEAFYRSARKAAFSTNLQTIYAATTLLVSILILINGLGIIQYAIGTLVVSILFIFVYAFLGKSLLEKELNKIGKVTKKDIKEITQKGFGYLLSPIWQAIFFQGTTFVVRLTLGPEAVAIFNTVRTLSRSVNQLFNMIDSTVFPELQYLIGAGLMDKARYLFRSSFMLILVLAFLGMGALFLFGPWLYEIWTKNELHPPDMMWNIFIIGIGFNALWWSASAIFRATNKPYQFAKMGVLGSVISVFLTYIFSKYWGLTGAALGNLGLEIILAVYVLPLSCKLIGQSTKNLPMDLKRDYHKNKYLFLEKFAAVKIKLMGHS